MGHINKVSRTYLPNSAAIDYHNLRGRRPNFAFSPSSHYQPVSQGWPTNRTPSHLLAVKQAFTPQGAALASLVRPAAAIAWWSVEMRHTAAAPVRAAPGAKRHRHRAHTPHGLARTPGPSAACGRWRWTAQAARAVLSEADKGPSRHARASQTSGTAPVFFCPRGRESPCRRLDVVRPGGRSSPLFFLTAERGLSSRGKPSGRRWRGGAEKEVRIAS